MQLENLSYALTQAIHNFGAAAVVGGSFIALKSNPDQLQLKKRMAWLVLIAWGAQVASGVIFGTVSFYFYGEFPDLHAVAIGALVIKVLCAVSGFVLAALYLRGAQQWSEKSRHRAWHALTGMGATALTAAAFLRWFS
ncbi:MAG: hypothetical protein M3A44_07725 [Gammaproteobacteria bacterium]